MKKLKRVRWEGDWTARPLPPQICLAFRFTPMAWAQALRRRASGLGRALRRGLARLAVDPVIIVAADFADLVRGACLGAHTVVNLEVTAPGAREDGHADFAVAGLARVHDRSFSAKKV